MREKNLKLKLAIFEKGLTQRVVAQKTGIPESHLSMAIHGKFILDHDQKNKLARALDRPEKDLFKQP